MASILDMLGFGSGDAGADSPYLGILAAPQRQQIADNSRQAVAAALLANSGPSFMPTSFGATLGKAMLAGQQAEDTGVDRAFKQAFMLPQIQGLNLTNEEKNLQLAGYRRLQALSGGSPATVPGANLGAMTPAAAPGPATGSGSGIMMPPGAPAAPSLGVLDPSVSPVSMLQPDTSANRALAAEAARVAPTLPGVDQTRSGPAAAPSLTAQRQPDGSYAVPPTAAAMPAAAPAAATSAAQPPPLFNVSNLYEQYKIMASTPGMAPLAAQVLGEIQKGMPEGAYIGADGSIQMRAGYGNYVQGKATAEALGKDLMAVSPDGRIVNQPGAVAARAQSAGAVSVAQANAALPAKLTEIGATGTETRKTELYKAGFEPMDIKVPQMGADGKPTGAYNTLRVPKSYLPQLAAAGTTPQGEPFYPPNVAETLKLDSEYLGKTLLPAKDAAVEGQGHAQTLFNALERLRQSPVASTGPTSQARLGALNVMNDVIRQFGGEGLKNDELASADAFSKASTRMAADMTRTLGSHEAAQIFMQIKGANPNWYMSPQSNLLVTNLINQAFQRKIDSYQTGFDAAKVGQLAQGAVNEFDKAHPESEYVQRAFKLSGMDPAWASKPQPAQRDVNRLAMAPDKYTDDFDKKFGAGRAAFVLGQRGSTAPSDAAAPSAGQPQPSSASAAPTVVRGQTATLADGRTVTWDGQQWK